MRTGTADQLAAIGSPSPFITSRLLIDEAPSTLNVTSGHVEWRARPAAPDASATDETEIRRTGGLTIVGDGVNTADLLAVRFAPYVDMTAPDGTVVEFRMGTFVTQLPRIDDDGSTVRYGLTLAPLESRWRQKLLDDWLTVEAGDDVLVVVADLLDTLFGVASSFPAGSTLLADDMTFEAGTDYYTVFRRLLNAVGYDQPVTTVDGVATSTPLVDLAGKGPEWVYAPSDGRVLVAGQVEPLDPDLPNKVRFVARQAPPLAEDGNGWKTYRNQSDGPSSIDARGEVFRQITVDASDQTQLEAYAVAQVQRIFAGGGLRWTGTVGLNPLHDDSDVITLARPRLNVTGGVWLVTGWRMELGAAAAMSTMSLTAEARVEVTAAP